MKNTEDNMVEVIRHQNGFFLEMAVALLDKNSIHSYVRGRDIGGMTHALVNTSIVGAGATASLFVFESDSERAMALLQQMPIDAETTKDSLPWLHKQEIDKRN